MFRKFGKLKYNAGFGLSRHFEFVAFEGLENLEIEFKKRVPSKIEKNLWREKLRVEPLHW